jgi:hypothetical protein
MKLFLSSWCGLVCIALLAACSAGGGTSPPPGDPKDDADVPDSGSTNDGGGDGGGGAYDGGGANDGGGADDGGGGVYGVVEHCNVICACEGCSDPELDDCIDDGNDTKKQIEAEGCKMQYDSYFACLEGGVVCEGAMVKMVGCDEEYQALTMCLQ